MFSEIFNRFATKSAVSVMFRGTLENAVTAELLDEVFAKTAKRQRCGELLFSSVVNLLAIVTTGSRKSVNEAYLARKEEFTVSVASVYNKLNGMETEVSRQMVRQTAMRMAEVVTQLCARCPPMLAGYRTKILDGNHSGCHRTPHRGVAEHCGRSVAGACLGGPGAGSDAGDRRFPLRGWTCPGAKSAAASLDDRGARDLWIADRNFCTTGFLFGIANQDAAFVIRQHKQNLTCELLGERHKIGRCPRGMIYEQQMQITDEAGKSRTIRRVTIELKESTRDGETEIHVLTNLPKTVANARSVADLYLHRWTVERAFHELDQAFNGEIKTLGYPGAALLSFCVALLAYNVTSVVKTLWSRPTATKQNAKLSRATIWRAKWLLPTTG